MKPRNRGTAGFRRLTRYPLRQWRSLLLVLGLTGGASLLTALQPWPLKILVDYALGDTPLPVSVDAALDAVGVAATPAVLIVGASVAGLALFALNSAVDVSLGWAWVVAGQRMAYELAADQFHRLQRRSLLFHRRRPVGDSLTRLTSDTWCVQRITDALLISPAQQVLILATIGAVAWHMDPQLTMLSFVVAPALGWSAFVFGRGLKSRSAQSREARSRLLSFVHQTLAAMPVVQAFCMERHNLGRYRYLAADVIASSQRVVLLSSGYRVLNGCVMTVGGALVLYVGGQRVLAGAISLGTLLVFLAYLRSAQNAFATLLTTYTTLKSIEVSVERVLEVLDVEEEVREAAGARALTGRARGHVRLEAVTVGYAPGRPVLEGVTLEARPGETVALVGPTGAGKSTLVALIPRFLDPWQGRVCLDGIDVRALTLASLRAQVALVLQEPFLLPLSVAENIAYGRPGASREEIAAAAAAANADEFIRRLPQGYDTVLAEGGATLSGGQRQRLALARAFLKDAPVLILDEPTAALDAATEAAVLAAAARLTRGRTTFIIAHRLSTVRRADQIAVIDAGRVVEAGSHGELLAAGGLYRRLYDLQNRDEPPEAGAATAAGGWPA